MQISALTDIVEGTLLNTPSISFVTQIHTNLTNINEGDAFFTSNPLDIPIAIANGVFSIIVDFKPTISDNEIDWIQVDNLDKAISNILRYRLLNYTIEYISVDKIFLKILSILKTKTLSNIVLLTNDIFQDFELLKDCDKDTLIFGINSNFLSAIGTDTKTVIHKKYNIKNLTSHSLFETSFSYQSRFFDRLKIPKVYIDTLLQILELFDYSLDLTRLDNSTLFKPIFINKGNKIVNFGQTNQFILANNDIEIANLEIKYLEENYCYGTIKIVNGTNLSEIQILNTIKKSTFNALYFIGLENKTIIKILQKNYKENRLIDL